MTRRQNEFLSLLKEKGCNFSFGDNAPNKIVGKSMVSLGNKKAKEKNVFLIEDLKHNLLSISQMCG